jgi:hypothetical protein
MLDNVRAEALFACDLQPSEHPGPDQVRLAVTRVLQQFGSRWCTARMAEEFGEHPETAQDRMIWARQVVHDCYSRSSAASRLCRLPRRLHPRPSLPPGRPTAGVLSVWWAATEVVLRPAIRRCLYPVDRYRHTH